MAAIEIRGVDQLIKKLGSVTGNSILVPPMKRSVDMLLKDIRPYPEERPGQTYQRGKDPRSERLRTRWTTKVSRSANGVIGKIGNNASYAPWVQSHQFQAWMHRGRWQTDLVVIDKNRAAIVRDFERAIYRAMSGREMT